MTKRKKINDIRWMRKAACKDYDRSWVFLPEMADDYNSAVAEAKAICATCTVRSDCKKFALRTEKKFGIWGGMISRELYNLPAKATKK